MASCIRQTKVVLIGCGGFGQEVASYIIDIAAAAHSTHDSITISDLVDLGQGRFDDIFQITGYKPQVHRTYSSVENIKQKQCILCFGDAILRQREYMTLVELGAVFFKAIHPLAYVAKTAQISEGCIVAPFAFIGPHALVGVNCAINVHSTIGHDAKLGQSVVVSPHVDINGTVECGDCTFFGSGSIVYPGTKIGRYVKVSAGSVVSQAIGDGELAVGNPAKGRRMFVVPA
jgi:sugar O-acyltransferase (sialic acid O-acetyltransferase NeuD family)